MIGIKKDQEKSMDEILGSIRQIIAKGDQQGMVAPLESNTASPDIQQEGSCKQVDIQGARSNNEDDASFASKNPCIALCIIMVTVLLSWWFFS